MGLVLIRAYAWKDFDTPRMRRQPQRDTLPASRASAGLSRPPRSAAPTVSLVVVCDGSREEQLRVFSLLSGAPSLPTEVIIVRREPLTVPIQAALARIGATHVAARPDASVADMRALGTMHATGDIVVVRLDHALRDLASVARFCGTPRDVPAALPVSVETSAARATAALTIDTPAPAADRRVAGA